MYPYEMRRLMRERGHDHVVKLKGGSLFSTIDRLSAGGLIQPLARFEGEPPEARTLDGTVSIRCPRHSFVDLLNDALWLDALEIGGGASHLTIDTR
jgi:hypothetical protein